MTDKIDSKDHLTLTDKEVGELWRRYKHIENHAWKHDYSIHDDVCLNLIRKLVEERAKYYGIHISHMGAEKDRIDKALRDFGIDPATWPK